MDFKNAVSIVDKANIDPHYLASEDYIEAQVYLLPYVDSLVLEVNNCNLNCSHCFRDYNPALNPPDKHIWSKAISESEKFHKLILSNGEPLQEHLKDYLKELKKFYSQSGGRRLSLNSNGKFASTLDKALEWLDFLHDIGFDMSKPHNDLSLTFGPTYNIPLTNIINLSRAAFEFYGNDLANNAIIYIHRCYNDLKSELGTGKQILKELDAIFDFDSLEDVSVGNNIRLQFNRKDGLKLDYNVETMSNLGNAKQDPRFQSDFMKRPVRRILPQDMSFIAGINYALELRANGDINLSNLGLTETTGSIYGNIKNDSLEDCLRQVYYDPIYFIHRLGGIRFLYHLARSINPNLLFELRSEINVAENLFADEKLIDTIKTEFKDPNDTADEYRKFIKTVDN